MARPGSRPQFASYKKSPSVYGDPIKALQKGTFALAISSEWCSSMAGRSQSSHEESLKILRATILHLLDIVENQVADNKSGDKIDKTQDRVLNRKEIEKTIEDISSKYGVPLEEETEKKRVYRRPHERPDPSRPANAEVNRLKKQFKLRLEPDLIDSIKIQAEAEGKSRQDWVEETLKAALDKWVPKNMG